MIDPCDIFLSVTEADLQHAEQLKTRLELLEFKVYLYTSEKGVGSWWETVSPKLEVSKAVLGVFSATTFATVKAAQFSKMEWDYGRDRLVPVRFEKYDRS